MMHVYFHLDRQREHRRDVDRKLELRRKRVEAEAARDHELSRPVLLSMVGDGDSGLARLAALNETPVPPGMHVVASVNGEVVAAQGLESKHMLTDPFRRTRHLTRL